MIEGISGLLNVHPDHERPLFEPSKRRLTWPCGAVATLFSAQNYEQLRGPQFDCAWIDELCKFRSMTEVWDQLNFSLRLGQHPRILITTTPRPCPLLSQLMQGEGSWVHVTRGSTFDNSANLAPHFLEEIKRRYGGTRLGEQELYGHILADLEGTLWTHTLIARAQVHQLPDLRRVVVAIDPAVTSHGGSDETGLVVAGICFQGNIYVLKDGSGKYKPFEWAQKALTLYKQHQADRMVAEVNQGGDLVTTMLHSLDNSLPVKTVHASRGKVARAEPVLSLYEQGRVFHHVQGGLETLEDQLCTFQPSQSSKSPDRLDALVWAITELALSAERDPLPQRLWYL
jgi:predicted phage terminase large subunit-like protein